MQTILRFSLDGDDGRLSTTLRKILEGYGFNRVSTSTYKGDLSPGEIAKGLNDFWQALEDNKTTASLDHFWMYTDDFNLAKEKSGDDLFSELFK